MISPDKRASCVEHIDFGFADSAAQRSAAGSQTASSGAEIGREPRTSTSGKKRKVQAPGRYQVLSRGELLDQRDEASASVRAPQVATVEPGQEGDARRFLRGVRPEVNEPRQIKWSLAGAGSGPSGRAKLVVPSAGRDRTGRRVARQKRRARRNRDRRTCRGMGDRAAGREVNEIELIR